MRPHEKPEVYHVVHRLGVAVHHMSLTLPRFGHYEVGLQVRRSSKSVSVCPLNPVHRLISDNEQSCREHHNYTSVVAQRAPNDRIARMDDQSSSDAKARSMTPRL
jgi:hypothetical protein